MNKLKVKSRKLKGEGLARTPFFAGEKTGVRGFTLFIAIVVTATLLLISTIIINLAVREAFITSAGRESQYAFYAADTGIECALYWDVQNPSGTSAFATSTGSQISCNEDLDNISNPDPKTVGGSTESNFTLTFLPEPYCAKVTVTKNPDNTTVVESRGYNTCDTGSARRLERAVRVTY